MKKRIGLVFALAFTLLLTACSKETKLTKMDKMFYDTFDTSILYVSYVKDEKDFEKEYEYVESNFQRLHKLYDGFRSYDGITNIKTINENAGKGPIKVDDDLFSLIKFSKDNYEKTNGKLNIAMGPVIKLWTDARNYNSDLPEDEMIVPSMEELNAANTHTNIDDIILDEANKTVELKYEDMMLDVGAIGKGYATELIAQGLKEMGVTHGSINAGGNVRTIGTPGDGRSTWGLAIQNPDLEAKDYLEVLYIGETSLVTSGDYQRYFEKDGIRYHHIIDPVTLQPESVYNSVSIITESSAIADYLSTVLYLSSKEEAKAILDKYDEDINVLWNTVGENKSFTDGLKQYMSSEGATSK